MGSLVTPTTAERGSLRPGTRIQGILLSTKHSRSTNTVSASLMDWKSQQIVRLAETARRDRLE